MMPLPNTRERASAVFSSYGCEPKDIIKLKIGVKTTMNPNIGINKRIVSLNSCLINFFSIGTPPGIMYRPTCPAVRGYHLRMTAGESGRPAGK